MLRKLANESLVSQAVTQAHEKAMHNTTEMIRNMAIR